MTPIPTNRDPYPFLPANKCAAFYTANPGLLSYTDAEFRDAIVKAGGMIANHATGTLKRWHELDGAGIAEAADREVERLYREATTSSDKIPVTPGFVAYDESRPVDDPAWREFARRAQATDAGLRRAASVESIPGNFKPAPAPKDRTPGPGAKVAGSFKRRRK